MTIRGITARFECDTCGAIKEIYMDPAMEVNGGSLADAAEYCAREDFMEGEVGENGTYICGPCVDRGINDD